MGMLDNIRDFFKGSKNTSVVQREDEYEKSMLVTQIVNLVDKIKKINSFDSSIWNLSNVSDNVLKTKSLDELNRIKDNLENRLSILTKKNQRRDPKREDLEESKWTGQKTRGLTDYEFDRMQRDDER